MIFRLTLFIISQFVLTFALASPVKVPLYKIEKQGEIAYLLGTIHLGVEYSALSEIIRQSAQSSDSLVVEVDMNKVSDMMQTMLPMGEPNSLKNQLTLEEWQKFYSWVAPGLGAGAEVLDRVHPVVANIFYSLLTLPETSQPIDATLMRQAADDGKEIFYFETPEEQGAALIQTQNIQSLKKTLALSFEELQSKTQQMVEMYVSGDIVGLNKYMKSQMTPSERHALINRRNIAWAEKFDSIFENQGTEFIAVGAGHLFGVFGLIPLLEEQGYKITVVD